MAVENAVPWFCVFESLCAYPCNFAPDTSSYAFRQEKRISERKRTKE